MEERISFFFWLNELLWKTAVENFTFYWSIFCYLFKISSTNSIYIYNILIVLWVHILLWLLLDVTLLLSSYFNNKQSFYNTKLNFSILDVISRNYSLKKNNFFLYNIYNIYI